MKRERFLMILQADNVENDYRLLKECHSLFGQGFDVSVFYYHVDNKPTKKGKISGSIPYLRKQLAVRRYFGFGQLLLVKLLEQWVGSALYVLKTRPDTVCVHDERFFGLLPLLWFLKKIGVIKRVLWDQRELPVNFLKNNVFPEMILRLSIACCDRVSVANEERLQVIVKALSLNGAKEKFCVICNYPDREFANLPVKDLPENVIHWLEGKEYVYAQCPSEPERFLYNLVESIMAISHLKLLITGRFNDFDRQYLKSKYGKEFDEKVLFIGRVDPYLLPIYIDHAMVSSVFYDMSSANRKYCAPNRLYQSLSRGVPVVVGCNPSMKNLIGKNGAGVVIDSDGREVDHIHKGLLKADSDREMVTEAAEKCKLDYIWEAQENSVMAFFRG